MIKSRNLNQIMTEIMPEKFRTLFRYEVFRYDERPNRDLKPGPAEVKQVQ